MPERRCARICGTEVHLHLSRFSRERSRRVAPRVRVVRRALPSPGIAPLADLSREVRERCTVAPPCVLSQRTRIGSIAMSPTQPPRRTPGTFLYSEPATSLDNLAADIAYLGVPYAQAYSYEDITNDQSNAPTAMREASTRIIRSIERYDFDLGGPLYAGKPIRAVDCGDIRTELGDPAAHARYTEHAVRKILHAGALPIVLGGDHGVPI